MFKTLSWKIEAGVGHLVLNQPPGNVMTQLFYEELREVTRSVLPGSGIKALLIYGTGRHFSSGADHRGLIYKVKEEMSGRQSGRVPAFLSENTESFKEIAGMRIPTIAAIRGACLGAALELALACRYRICGEGAVLGLPEATYGLMPGCGGSVRLTGIIGRSKAIEVILTGRNFSAEEAYHWGIVQQIVPRRAVVEVAVKLADKLTVSSQQSTVGSQVLENDDL